jgi:hypothetical protein
MKMETMGKTFVSMLLDACLPGTGLYHSPSSHPVHRRKKYPNQEETKVQATFVRKSDQVKWFHCAVNINLVVLITMALMFPLPGHLNAAYTLVCLVCGWLFYFTLDKMTHRILNKSGIEHATHPLTERGRLSQVAGKDVLSRFTIVALLIGLLIAAVQVHPVFTIALGLVARLMIESQIRIFINELSVHNPTNGKKNTENAAAK